MSTSPLPHQDPAHGFLRRFQVSQDAFAFREIVEHYGGLVEGTARRLLHGDHEGARDVAQRVFMDLAKKAPQLAPDSQLGGWLHRHTVFLASHHNQADQRRRRREREAAYRMELDQPDGDLDSERAAEVHAALTKLPEDDRTALILRYWENRPLREVGHVLGIGEDAAQKRVSRALDRLRSRLGAGTAAASTAVLGQCLAFVPKAEAAVPSWTSQLVASALNPGNAPAAGGILTLSSTWKAGLLGAGAAAGICCALLIPQNLELRRALASAQIETTKTAPATKLAALAQANPKASRAGSASLEERIRQLEARLDTKSVREQWVASNLKRARERADRDRQTFSADELTELESTYQLAKKEPDAESQALALAPLLKEFGASNRAGCAVLRLARMTVGSDRERWLIEAISNHSDAYYLDGTSVGAMARLQLAAEYAQSGRHAEAVQFRREIAELFPEATDHDGLPVLEALRGTGSPD